MGSDYGGVYHQFNCFWYGFAAVPHRIQQSMDEYWLSPGLAGDDPVCRGAFELCIHRD